MEQILYIYYNRAPTAPLATASRWDTLCLLRFIVYMKFLSHLVTFIGLPAALYGIFRLPKDLEDINEAAKAWERWLAIIDQNMALWVFAVIATGYIIWIDIRPLILNKFLRLKPANLKKWRGRKAYRIWEIAFLKNDYEPILEGVVALEIEKKHPEIRELRYAIETAIDDGAFGMDRRKPDNETQKGWYSQRDFDGQMMRYIYAGSLKDFFNEKDAEIPEFLK